MYTNKFLFFNLYSLNDIVENNATSEAYISEQNKSFMSSTSVVEPER